MHQRPVHRLLMALVLAHVCAFAQAPGVPIYEEGPGARAMSGLRSAARKLRGTDSLLTIADVTKQLDRHTCSLELPRPGTIKLDTRELWNRARRSHLRVGWYYSCTECNRWHLELSGGYAITTSAVVTCAHVIGTGSDPVMKDGFLVAADDEDHLFVVKEILAINRATDCAILRLDTDTLHPLPLGQDIAPGDPVYCFSDPMDRRGVFSSGIVNRFMRRAFLRKAELTPEQRARPEAVERPVWMQVSAEWAPGSSGSAVLDACGNAVAHVSEIEPMLDEADEEPADTKEASEKAGKGGSTAAVQDAPPLQSGTMIVFHDAIAASNVRALVKR